MSAAAPTPDGQKPDSPEPSLMRNLGAFVGEVWKGITSDPSAPPPAAPPTTRVVQERVDEHVIETDAGPVKLRRRVIDEVELPPAPHDRPRRDP